MNDDKVKSLRAEIDKLDQQIAEILIERLEKAEEILACKAGKGIPGRDRNRENEIVARLEKKYAHKLSRGFIERIYKNIFDEALKQYRKY